MSTSKGKIVLKKLKELDSLQQENDDVETSKEIRQFKKNSCSGLRKDKKRCTFNTRVGFSTCGKHKDQENQENDEKFVISKTQSIEEEKWKNWNRYLDLDFGEFGNPFDPENPYNWDGDDMIGFR